MCFINFIKNVKIYLNPVHDFNMPKIYASENIDFIEKASGVIVHLAEILFIQKRLKEPQRLKCHSLHSLLEIEK